jgi:hypothetical protein
MKHYLKTIFSLATMLLLTTSLVQAQSEKKVIIALETDGFELAETDISSLAVGEAKTIETESGKVIDILRTVDGAEVYVDGELLEMDFGTEGLHEELMIRKHVKVICDDDEECDKHVVIHSDGDHEFSMDMTDDGDNIFIHKEIEISCTDEDDETSCEEMVWISDGEDIDFEELHKAHADGEAHKVIVIRDHSDSND